MRDAGLAGIPCGVPQVSFSLSMIFSENRHSSPIAIEDMLFGIMPYPLR
jgi:hypothetical protein